MKSLSTVVLSLMIIFSTPAIAKISGGAVIGGTALLAGGKFVELTTPLKNPFGSRDSVDTDNFESFNLFGFDENQRVMLTGSLRADLGEKVIPSGTIVSSHYIFFDPHAKQHIIGTVRFDSNILSVIFSTVNLDASDLSLGSPGVNYLKPFYRGLEPGDSVKVIAPNQILFDTHAISPGDYVRVLTATPEPSGLGLQGLAFAVLIAIRVARKSRTSHQ